MHVLGSLRATCISIVGYVHVIPWEKAIFLACSFLVVNQQVYGRTCHIDTENKTKRAEMTDAEVI